MMNKSENKRKRNIGFILLIILLTVIFFGAIILKRNNYQIPFDSFYQQYPWINSTVDTYAKGEVPLWSNQFFSGFPTFADPQVGTFYPANILLTLFCDKVTGYLPYFYIELSIIVHYALIGIFTYLLCRELKLSRGAALIGAIIFEFCGYVSGHPQHYSTIMGLVWLPFCMWMLFKMFRHFKYRDLVLFSIGFTLSILGGHVQTTLYSGMTLFAVLLYLTYRKYKENTGKEARKFFLLVCLGFVISALIASIQLLPTLELMANSTRDKMSFEAFSKNNNSPLYMISMFIPYIFGSGFTWINMEPTEQYMYIGLSAIILLLVCLMNRNKLEVKNKNMGGYIKFWITIAIVALIFSFGAETFIQYIMYFVPLLNKLRRSVNYMFIFFFAISILSAYGLDLLVYRIKEINKEKLLKILKILCILLVAVAIILSGILYYIHKTPVAEHTMRLISKTWLFAVGLSILTYMITLYSKEEIGKGTFVVCFVIITIIDLFSFNANVVTNATKNNSVATLSYNYMWNDPSVPNIIRDQKYTSRTLLAGLELYNSGSVAKFSDIWGYNPLIINDYYTMLEKIGFDSKSIQLSQDLDISSRYFDILGMKYLVTTKEYIKNNPNFDEAKYKKVYEQSDIMIYENLEVLPLYQFTKAIENETDSQKILDNMAQEKYNPKEVIYSTKLANQEFQVSAQDSIQLVEKSSNKVVLQTHNEHNAYLVAADVYYPGWKAKVNGKKVALDQVDYVLRGVAVNAGDNTVEIYYAPTSLTLGILVSAGGVLILVITGMVCRHNKKISIHKKMG